MSFFGSDGDISLIFQKPSFPIPVKGPSLRKVQFLPNFGESEEGWHLAQGLHNSFLEAFKWVLEGLEEKPWDAQNLSFSGSIFEWEHIGDPSENAQTENRSTDGSQLFSEVGDLSWEEMVAALESSRKMRDALVKVLEDPKGLAKEIKKMKADPQNIATLSVIFREGIKENVSDGYEETRDMLLSLLADKIEQLEDDEKEAWENMASDFENVSRDVLDYLNDEQKIEKAFEKLFGKFNKKRIGRKAGFSAFSSAALSEYFRKKRKYTDKKFARQIEKKKENERLQKSREENKVYLKKLDARRIKQMQAARKKAKK